MDSHGDTPTTVEGRLASAFGLAGDEWLRHANPKSVYSRFSVLPLFVVAVWSRVWLGWWALLPVAATVAWTYLNPRLFDEPASFDSWAARGVLGERIWADRDSFEIDRTRRRQLHAITAVQVVGVPPFVWGLYTLAPWVTATGLVTMVLAKVWFLDRMARLFDDYRDTDAVRAWLA